jgi:hypothetical protein
MPGWSPATALGMGIAKSASITATSPRIKWPPSCSSVVDQPSKNLAVPARFPQVPQKDRSGVPERNRTSERARTRPYPVTVIAALHNPLTVLMTHDLADVVRPDNNRSDPRTACIRAIAGPSPCEIVLGTGIGAHLGPHVPPTPGGRAPGIAIGA